ncbi:hypothetical protein P170DRAFT_207936 [Aspergillus steynii IBT 23096]|uniref:Uncharacterized protein n=1 Tax=Aspergillus steynii IBT 23096 TaxID=1392250 RepID=A0A2I2G5L7_9EURO|nr:uncharacterized protein P170DRAFT_207936 [Aspergillus steynii IBT 23096]PLB48170.1 hypothetical protein P170DRAFT_207936 [Aspergillus steynii IBT 23096]
MLFGLLTFPVGAFLRIIPDGIIARVFDGIGRACRPLKLFFGGFSIGRATKARLSGLLQSVNSSPGSDSVPPTTKQIAAPQEFDAGEPLFNLLHAIEDSRNPMSDGPYGFEVHPGTRKDDIVLIQPVQDV